MPRITEYEARQIIQKECKNLAFAAEEAAGKLNAEEKKALEAVLKEDPRPGYQDDPEREYVFGFSGKQIHFLVSGGILTVTEI